MTVIVRTENIGMVERPIPFFSLELVTQADRPGMGGLWVRGENEAWRKIW